MSSQSGSIATYALLAAATTAVAATAVVGAMKQPDPLQSDSRQLDDPEARRERWKRYTRNRSLRFESLQQEYEEMKQRPVPEELAESKSQMRFGFECTNCNVLSEDGSSILPPRFPLVLLRPIVCFS